MSRKKHKMIDLYLDTGNLDKIKEYKHYVKGVTINARDVLMNWNGDIYDYVKEVYKALIGGDYSLSIQLPITDVMEYEHTARELIRTKYNKNISLFIKIPAIKKYMHLIKRLNRHVNATIIVDKFQLLSVMPMRPTYISVFYNKLINIYNEDYFESLIQLFQDHAKSLLIIGSIHSLEDIENIIAAIVPSCHLPYYILTVHPPQMEELLNCYSAEQILEGMLNPTSR